MSRPNKEDLKHKEGITEGPPQTKESHIDLCIGKRDIKSRASNYSSIFLSLYIFIIYIEHHNLIIFVCVGLIIFVPGHAKQIQSFYRLEEVSLHLQF